MQEDALDYTNSRSPCINTVYDALTWGILQVNPVLGDKHSVQLILDDEDRTSIILHGDMTWEIE